MEDFFSEWNPVVSCADFEAEDRGQSAYHEGASADHDEVRVELETGVPFLHGF